MQIDGPTYARTRAPRTREALFAFQGPPMLKARPVQPSRAPTLVRLSPLWRPRDITPQPHGLGHADPTADQALRRSHLRAVPSSRRHQTRRAA